jgi:hypothetical protein
MRLGLTMTAIPPTDVISAIMKKKGSPGIGLKYAVAQKKTIDTNTTILI